MSPERKFYVYAHYRKSDGQLFYIGKGCASRYSSIYGRSRFWSHIVKKHGFRPRKIKVNMYEQCSLSLEKVLIFLHSDLICNLAPGGSGGLAGVPRSQDWKDKVANYHRGRKRSKETRKRIAAKARNRLSDPKNHWHTELKISIWWNADGRVERATHLEISEKYDLSLESLKRVQSGYLFSYKGWKVVGVRNYPKKGGVANNTACKVVRIWFKSGQPNFIGTKSDFAIAKGVTPGLLYPICSGKNKTFDGWSCREL